MLSSVGQIIGNGIPSFFNEFANGFIVLLFDGNSLWLVMPVVELLVLVLSVAFLVRICGEKI